MQTVKKTTKASESATKATTNKKKVAAPKKAATVKKKVTKAATPTVRTRASKKLYRQVTIKKLIQLYGEDGSVLVSANAVEAKQLELLKEEADKQLSLEI